MHFLQWALPRLDMEWKGFRKVRRQVCKRIQRRMQMLEIQQWATYKAYLESHPEEWKLLDGFCRITISRFYRDYYIYDYLGVVILPGLLNSFKEEEVLKFISLGCASGEEPYTLAIIWKERIDSIGIERPVQIWGLDADPLLLERARDAIYSASSLRELPIEWKSRALQEKNGAFQLKAAYRTMVKWIHGDIRRYDFKGPYHIVCCRNLVNTYFSKPVSVEIFQKIRIAMPEGSALILGANEMLPAEVDGFIRDSKVKQIYWSV